MNISYEQYRRGIRHRRIARTLLAVAAILFLIWFIAGVFTW